MNPNAGEADRPLRALLLGPAYTATETKGMPSALTGVVEQLQARGWQVEARIRAPDARRAPSKQLSPADLVSTTVGRRPSLLDRHPELFALWTWAVPNALRRLISLSLRPTAYFENLSHNLRVAEGLLAAAAAYDLVLLSIDEAAPGLAALVTARAEPVAIISLYNLAEEISAGHYRWLRRVARWRLGQRAHPLLFQPLPPAQVRLALFASNLWREQAVQAGLPPARARTIHFGVPQPLAPPRPSVGRHRILLVGRLSLDKGAHLLLRALPRIRAAVPDVTVTIIAGSGPTAYRRLLLHTIRTAKLEQVVTLVPGMAREDLQAAYAAHDVLFFFYSIYAEPVALVLMEAFAAGLPVVASAARPGAALVRAGQTCLCYQPASAGSLAQAMIKMLTEADLQTRLAARAQQLVREEFSLEKMGHAYDAALRELVARPAVAHAA